MGKYTQIRKGAVSKIPTQQDPSPVSLAEIDTLISSVDKLKAGLSVEFEALGNYGKYGIRTGVLHYIVTQNITITDFILLCGTAGSAGSTTMDLQMKRGAGAFASLLATSPSVPRTAGAYANSKTGAGATQAVIGATTNLLVGDILRMDLSAVQTNGIDAIGYLTYTVTGA